VSAVQCQKAVSTVTVSYSQDAAETLLSAISFTVTDIVNELDEDDVGLLQLPPQLPTGQQGAALTIVVS
jgi:hypothetical protein